MALSISTQDLQNFPGIIKKVNIDISSIVPANNEGDEAFVILANTSAYSDVTEKTAIQSLYLTDTKQGWCKSSGLVGYGGKFNITDSANTLKVKIDSTIGGDSSGFYTITLTPNDDNTPVEAEVVASDIEAKIRATALDAEDIGFSLSYRNASVIYKKGRLWISSGSISKYYVGNGRSSVEVKDGLTNGCADKLGFNLPISSKDLSSVSAKEASLSTDYTAGDTDLYISSGTGFVQGDCFMITDGTFKEYFITASGIGDTHIIIDTNSIANDYTAGLSKVQLLREQDPDVTPASTIMDIDQLVRFGLKHVINQIDYSA